MLEFLSTNLPILLCFLFGMAMLVLEAFLPGFGVFGITGILLQAAAIIMTGVWYGLSAALIMFIIMLSLMTLAISMSLRSAAKGRISRSKLILKDRESAKTGDTSVLIGKTGITITALRPAGLADFDGVRLDVMSEGDFIDKGCTVRIEKADGSHIVVRALPVSK